MPSKPPCQSTYLLNRLQVPDTVSVLLNRTVGREEAHAGNAENGLVKPSVAVLISLINHLLGLDVRVEIIRDKVEVTVVSDRADEWLKVVWFTEGTLADLRKDSGQVRIKRGLVGRVDVGVT